MRIPIHTTRLLGALVALALGTAIASTEGGATRLSVAPVAGSLHHGVQAGRLELASEPGGYIDLAAPLEPHEERALESYHPVDRSHLGSQDRPVREDGKRPSRPLPGDPEDRYREPRTGTRSGG